MSFINEKKVRKYFLKELKRKGVMEFTPPGQRPYSEILADSTVKFLNHLVNSQLNELTDPETFRDSILDGFKIAEAARKAGRDPAEFAKQAMARLKNIPLEVVPKTRPNIVN